MAKQKKEGNQKAVKKSSTPAKPKKQQKTAKSKQADDTDGRKNQKGVKNRPPPKSSKTHGIEDVDENIVNIDYQCRFHPDDGDYVKALLDIGRVMKYDLTRSTPLIKDVGKLAKMAYARFYDDFHREDPPWKFDYEKANMACHLIQSFTLPDGKYFGVTKFKLDPWQALIVICRYGFTQEVLYDDRDPDSPMVEVPRFTEFYLEFARGQGKTSFGGGLLLCDTIIFDYDGGDFLIAATTIPQGGKMYNKIKRIIRSSPALHNSKDLNYNLDLKDVITIEGRDDAELFVISSNASENDGLAPVSYFLEEFHAHKSAATWEVLHSAKGKHPCNISTIITTGGRNTYGVCYQQRGLAQSILEGYDKGFTIDSFFAFIATPDKGDYWRDLFTIVKANPSWHTRPLLRKEVADQAEKALTRFAEDEFKIKRLNIWLTGHSRWLEVDQWDMLALPERTIDYYLNSRDEKNWQVFFGVDLSEFNDLTALTFGFRDESVQHEQMPEHFFTKFYAPRQIVENKIREHRLTYYADWVDEGHLTLTDGAIVNWGTVVRDIEWLVDNFTLGGGAFDQVAGAHQLVLQMQKDLSEEKIKIVRKNVAQVGPAALDFEARVTAAPVREELGAPQLLTHDGNPVMRFCVNNAVVTRKVDGTILPKKPDENSELKIDGVDSTLHCKALMMATGPGQDIEDWSLYG